MGADLFSMQGKTVIFTGGCGKLGRVMVRALLDYDATVVVPSLTDRFDSSYDAFRQAGKLVFLRADLRDTAQIQASFLETERRFGKVDVLVNCAAYGGASGGKNWEYRLDRIPDEAWEIGVDGTLNIVYRCTREILPIFERGGSGVIVNIGSMYGLIAPDFDIYGDNIPWNHPSYSAGKAGVIQFTRYCASALARKNIRVNCLTPGAFPNVTPDFDQGFLARLSAKAMLKRVGKAEELCGALLLLCSDASSFMTGTNIVVDGGMTQW